MEHVRFEDKPYPKDSSSFGGQYRAFKVEGRYNYTRAQSFGAQIFDNRWQTIDFEKAEHGVPIGNEYLYVGMNTMGLYSYQAAQALRWWIHAALEAGLTGGGLCFETRLVEYEVKYSYTSQAIAHYEHLGGDAGESVRQPKKQNNQP